MFIPDSQLKGLYQRIRTTGNKWVVKAKQRGINKPVTVTLGREGVISIPHAIRIARDNLALTEMAYFDQNSEINFTAPRAVNWQIEKLWS
tara:strand:+ start:670 stop:939 length:270 start_codon:yes stop_codon:yes gene_type:complete